MRQKIYCDGLRIAGICLLFYIQKAQSFNCDGNSSMDTLKCDAGKCCTPEMINVFEADVTETNGWCLSDLLHTIENKRQGQLCVHVYGPCIVVLSYCFKKEPITTGRTRHTLPPNATFYNQSTPRLGTEMASYPGDKEVTDKDFTDNPITSNTTNVLVSEVTRRSNIQTSFFETISTEETGHPLPPNVTSYDKSTPRLGTEISSYPEDIEDTSIDFTNDPVASNTRNDLVSEETRRTNTQTSHLDGVVIGVLVIAVILVLVFVLLLLYIRHRKKRRKESTTSPLNTVVRFSNAEYASTGSDGSRHVPSERKGSTTSGLLGVPDDKTYANVNQKDSSFENGQIPNDVTIDVYDLTNDPGKCPMDDGDHDQRSTVELNNIYDHTNNTNNNNIYDNTYQERSSFDDTYDKTNQFHDGDDTYECT